MTNIQARFQSGPQTFTVVEAVDGGQLVEGRSGGLVGVAAAGSERVLGVALAPAAPDGTYAPVSGQALPVGNIVGHPPTVAVAMAPLTVPVTYVAAAAFGQLLSAAALGKVTPFTGSPTSTNEVQTVTITGTPTGGTFTLTFSGQTTAAIAYNATAAAVQTALEALSNIDPGDAIVTGGPGPGTAYTVTFGGAYADTDVAQMTATGSFTGGSSPAVAVTTATPGVAGSVVVGQCVEPNGVAAGAVGQMKLR